MDISTIDADWFDLETNDFVDGWWFESARDANEAGQIAGLATDGVSQRAALFDELLGFALLPRAEQSPYREGSHAVWSINENGVVQGSVRPNVTGYPWKTFLCNPANPNRIDIIDDPASGTPWGIGDGMFMTYTDGGAFAPSIATLYSFAYSDGELQYELLDTIPAAFPTYINDHGAFGYPAERTTTRSIRLYLPGQGSLTVYESANDFDHGIHSFRANNSNDFLYNVNGVPYLYRYSNHRSYRLYDLADSYTKDALFVSSAGVVKDGSGAASSSGVFHSVVSDDDAAGDPAADPFDTISGSVRRGDSSGDWWNAIVLTPIPKP